MLNPYAIIHTPPLLYHLLANTIIFLRKAENR